MFNMSDYKLSTELSQNIVDGLMAGYRDYIEVRREKARTMKISSAYAWVKGNHIDDQIAKTCEPYGVKSKVAKAGLTWHYLQFMQPEEKVLFIVKNAKYFNEDQVDIGKNIHGNTKGRKLAYMEPLLEINRGIDFSKVQTVNPNGSVQLELFDDFYVNDGVEKEVSELVKVYDRFYIITYAIDESQLISRISLFLPNPIDKKAYPVDDLTHYISTSQQPVIDEEVISALTTSVEAEENIGAHYFDIGIKDDAKEGSDRKNKEV